MLRLELKAVAEFTRQATTEELLDRVTVYRAGMEPVALDLMEGELDRRGITREEIAEHDEMRRRTAIMLPDGMAMKCSLCDRPAVYCGWSWHRLFGWLPFFPVHVALCERHASPRRARSQ